MTGNFRGHLYCIDQERHEKEQSFGRELSGADLLLGFQLDLRKLQQNSYKQRTIYQGVFNKSSILFMFIAIFLVLLIAAGIFGQSGIEVSRERYAWRSYYKFLGFTFGRWQALPPIKGITLKYFSTISSSMPGTIESLANWNGDAARDEQLVVLLSVIGSQNGIVLRTISFSELLAAQAFAQEIANELQVSVQEFLPPHATTKAV